ncbi:protease modulator HflC [Rhodobacter sp.]
MRAIYILPAIFIALVLFLSSVFIVDEREKVLVLQFGEIVQEKDTPAWAGRSPSSRKWSPTRIASLGLQTATIEVTLLGERRLVVDAFARWRITDLKAFRQATGASGEDRAQILLGNILQQAIPEVLGKTTQDRVLSQDRTALMNEIRDIARREAEALGVTVIDVRLTRTDLPEQNLNASYARMRAEREREAADEVARGGEAAQRVRAAADRTVVEETSAARRTAETIRGEADAERNRILAEAYGQDPEFFAFMRSLDAYRKALKGENSTIVMQPDSEFFDYLNGEAGAGREAPAPATAPAVEAPATVPGTTP